MISTLPAVDSVKDRNSTFRQSSLGLILLSVHSIPTKGGDVLQIVTKTRLFLACRVSEHRFYLCN